MEFNDDINLDKKKKKWSKPKQLLVGCIFCSLLLGFGVVGVYVGFIMREDYSWVAEYWIMIPMAFAIGFILPPIVYALSKIGF